jgi:hypothetical protein
MQFMVRVEFHYASLTSYERLHVAMANESFSRVLTSARTGQTKPMPPGTYWCEFSTDPWIVLEAAKRAALPIDSAADIVVSGAGQIVYHPEIPHTRLAHLLVKPLAPRATESPLSAFYKGSQPANPKGGFLGFSSVEPSDSSKWLESILGENKLK